MADAITAEFAACGFPDDTNFILAGLRNGRFLILLDGLDEVRRTALHHVVGNLNTFVQRYRDNRFITSCRTAFNRSFLDSYKRALEILLERWNAEKQIHHEQIAELESDVELEMLTENPLTLFRQSRCSTICCQSSQSSCPDPLDAGSGSDERSTRSGEPAQRVGNRTGHDRFRLRAPAGGLRVVEARCESAATAFADVDVWNNAKAAIGLLFHGVWRHSQEISTDDFSALSRSIFGGLAPGEFAALASRIGWLDQRPPVNRSFRKGYPLRRLSCAVQMQ